MLFKKVHCYVLGLVHPVNHSQLLLVLSYALLSLRSLPRRSVSSLAFDVVIHFSARPRQITVNSMDCNEFASQRVRRPLPKSPFQPSAATTIRMASMYERSCLDPIDCLVVFTTRKTFTAVSLTMLAARPIPAFRRNFEGNKFRSQSFLERILYV